MTRAARDLVLLLSRLVLGGYLTAHGLQKLVGAFDGPGLSATSKGFARIGLRPGIVMAATASAAEVSGGLLTAAGAFSPLGPIAIAQTMAVASTTHRPKGAFAAKGGYELALTNLATALLLAVFGPGRLSADHLFRTRLPRWKLWLAVLGGLAAASTSIRMVLLAASPPATPTPTTDDDADAPR